MLIILGILAILVIVVEVTSDESLLQNLGAFQTRKETLIKSLQSSVYPCVLCGLRFSLS